MSLYQSVLSTLYKDALLLENSLNQTVLHGSPENLHNLVGHTARAQWFRVFINAISEWCKENTHATEAPESFLPATNSDINAVMTGATNLADSTEDSMNTVDAAPSDLEEAE